MPLPRVPVCRADPSECAGQNCVNPWGVYPIYTPAARIQATAVVSKRYGEAMSDDPSAAAPPTPEPQGALPDEPIDTGYTSGGVPTFESVREKIETRYGTAIGSSELAAESPEGRTVEEQYDARQRAAAERLAQIRESMKTDKPQ